MEMVFAWWQHRLAVYVSGGYYVEKYEMSTKFADDIYIRKM